MIHPSQLSHACRMALDALDGEDRARRELVACREALVRSRVALGRTRTATLAIATDEARVAQIGGQVAALWRLGTPAALERADALVLEAERLVAGLVVADGYRPTPAPVPPPRQPRRWVRPWTAAATRALVGARAIRDGAR
jgi:hypothetical protein